MKRFMGFFLLIFSCLAFAAPKKATAQDRVYRVGYVTDRIPVSFENDDGSLDGVSRYILSRISELSGLEFEFVPLPTKDVTYDYLISNGIDFVTSVEYNEENKNANGILISSPYLSSKKVVVARNGLNFDFKKNYTAAVATGSQTLKKVLARLFPNFDIKDYDSITDCFDAVKSGEVDLMIQNQYVVEYWLTKPKYEKLKVIPIAGLDDKLCFSAVFDFDGKHQKAMSAEKGKELIDAIDSAIEEITEDEESLYVIQGVMDNQYKYSLSDFLYRYSYSFIIISVFAVIIIILIVLFIKQRLRAAKIRAEANAKGNFLSTMSHELRTPLNGLIGLNQLMGKRLDNKTKMEEYLKKSNATAKYLLSLVDNILDSSKIEAQKLDILTHPIDLAFVMDTVYSIESNSMHRKKLNFTIEKKIEYPHIMGDEVRIQQVLLNLLDNARKFTNEGGNVVVSLSQKKTENGDILTTIDVSDTGCGMSEEFMSSLFEMFTQERNTVSNGGQGTGLGLSISRRLARLMGGDLTCVSKKGVGSIFTFTFISSEIEPQEEKAKPQITAKGTRILVAEDNELNGEIVMEVLQANGLDADIAHDGKEAVEMFEKSEKGTYGVILMDLLMPKMNGFESTKAIRSLDRPDAKSVQIIACTANTMNNERESAFKAGMDDFMTKPLDFELLIEKISKA